MKRIPSKRTRRISPTPKTLSPKALSQATGGITVRPPTRKGSYLGPGHN